MSKGYNRPAGAGVGNMLSQLRKMQEQLTAAQSQLAEEVVTASVGGGAVKVSMTGDQRCISISINPELIQTSDQEMLQEILVSGINMAIEQSKALAAEKLGPLTGGLGNLGI